MSEAQRKTIEMPRVSDAAVVAARDLVRLYDGDQADRPLIEVAGFFLMPASGPRGNLPEFVERLRGAVAKRLDAAGESVADQVVQWVAELPDRTSPDNWPEAMLVTSDELTAIVKAALMGGKK